jgi:hypothetical protein
MIEPEETVEAKLIALLDAANVGVFVIGALTPAPDGVEKNAPDTCIDVSVDAASQDLDWMGPGVPCTYSVRVAVNVAYADDKTGAVFRDVCRAVRGALAALLGDGCAALDGDDFRCSSFVLGSTETSQTSAGESGGMTKTYNAIVTGRSIPTSTTNEQEES